MSWVGVPPEATTCSSFFISVPPTPTVALIGLEETSYRVGGGEGEEEVEVCVVTNSTLERNVVLTLTTTTTVAAPANKPEKNGMCNAYMYSHGPK